VLRLLYKVYNSECLTATCTAAFGFPNLAEWNFETVSNQLANELPMQDSNCKYPHVCIVRQPSSRRAGIPHMRVIVYGSYKSS